MDRVRAFLKRSEPTVWHFWGDSITHGAHHLYGQRDYVQHFEERVRYEIGRKDDAVIRMAVSGYTTRDLLKKFDLHVTRFKPDVMFLMIGMNDCDAPRGITCAEFAANLRTVATRTAEMGGLLVLQTTCPIIPGLAASREPTFPDYMQAIRDAAAELMLPLIDHTSHWLNKPVSQRCAWMDDAFHPNGQGHLAFARLLLRDLGLHDPASITGRLFLPWEPS
jgi:lysophospholipase L1-like esterase